LGQYVNQVTNDIRKNTPSIEVLPDVDGDKETAEIQQDLIREILYNSDADTCFDTAATYAVKCSIGFIRIDTDYTDNNNFDQKLKVCTVVNPLKIYIDSESTSLVGDDIKHAFILDTINKEDFREKYKGKEPVSFTESSHISCDDDEIVTVEYFKISIKRKKVGLTLEGSIEEIQDGVEYKQTREIEEKTIKRYMLSGDDVLESTEFVGSQIPVVPVFGNQTWIDGDREIRSLIRHSKDAQKMFNYWKSLETELLQKQPRANFIAAIRAGS